jgi:hypothetical protein
MYIYTDMYMYICIYIHTYMDRKNPTIKTGTLNNDYDDDDDVYLYKNYNERVSQNLYSIRFHTDQPKRYKYK